MTQSCQGNEYPSDRRPQARRAQRNHRKARAEKQYEDMWMQLEFYKNSFYRTSGNEVARPTIFSCYCTWESQKGLTTNMTYEYGFQNLLKGHSMSKFFITRHMYYAKHCFIDMANHKYPNISSKRIMCSNRVEAVISNLVNKELEQNPNAKELDVRKKGRENVMQLLKNIQASMSSWLLKMTGWVLLSVFNQIFDSVIINKGQLEMIEEVSKRKSPLIFVPLHRSHVDCLLVTWVLFHRNMPAPLVAAGDGLQIPIFGSLLRGLGGFFIRRSARSAKYKDSDLYGATLNTYITQALLSGYNMEFFIEGGRSRSGKHCCAKEGILTVISNAFVHEDLQDAYIIPVGINYEKLVEGNYVREQLGQSKVPETFFGAVRAICKTLTTNHGFARIDFGKPFSLREYYQFYTRNISPFPINGHMHGNADTQAVSCETPTSCVNILVPEVTQHDREFVQCLSKHIVYNASRGQAVMSTNVLAWVLCNMCRQPTSLKEVVSCFEMIRKEIVASYVDLGFTGSSEDVVRRAINLLGPSLVRVDSRSDDIIVTPAVASPEIIELNYYSNSVTSILALKAITATTVAAIAEPTLGCYTGMNYQGTVSIDELSSKCLDLSHLLRNEFILFAPCSTLLDAISKAIQQMNDTGFLSQQETFRTMSTGRRGYCDPSDFGEEDVREDDPSYRVHPTVDNMRLFNSLVNCLSPFIDAYYYMLCCSVSLVNEQIPEKEFIKTVQKFIEQMVEEGTIDRQEILCVEPIKNAIKTFVAFSMFNSVTVDNETHLSLVDDYNCESEVFYLMKQVPFFMKKKPEIFHHEST